MDCPVRVDTLLLLARALVEEERFVEATGLLEEILATSARVGRDDSDEASDARELLEICRAAAAVEVG